MKFRCLCDNVIRDQSDNLSNKADLLPDQMREELWNVLDGIFSFGSADASGQGDRWFAENYSSEAKRSKPSIDVVRYYTKIMSRNCRSIYQCDNCGRLVVFRGDRLVYFKPDREEEEHWRDILSKPAESENES